MSNSPKPISSTRDQPLSFRTQSGSQSCRAYPSISTQYLADATQRSTTRKSRTRLGTLPSRPGRPQRPKPSDQQGTGSSPGHRQQLQLPSLSPIEAGNARNTENTFSGSSQPLQ